MTSIFHLEQSRCDLCGGSHTPVAPEASLPPWQHLTSEGVHRLLYVLVLATTITGWAFASFRDWSISLFFTAPLPMLAPVGSAAVRAVGRLQEWALLIVIVVHVAAALVHLFFYRDRVFHRILPVS
jgi:cytochrome b561